VLYFFGPPSINTALFVRQIAYSSCTACIGVEIVVVNTFSCT